MLKIGKFIRPLYARDPNETHRVAHPLELFYDLIIVISFAVIARYLHHAIVEGHYIDGIIHFLMAFMIVWWPWNNFTWFSSAFDNNDPFYRITVMVMMMGSMIIASSLPLFFEDGNFFYSFIGYVIMRMAQAVMWFRVWRHNPAMRKTAFRYVLGLSLVQLYWAAMIFVFQPEAPLFYFLYIIGIFLECFVPWFASKAHQPSWHRHHIIERFGLLNIIVLGEIILAATIALEFTFVGDHLDWNLISNSFCGILIALGMFWLYFSDEDHDKATNHKRIFQWGYGHVIVFAAAVATGAGLEVMNAAYHHSEDAGHAISASTAAWALSIPVSLYMLGIWYVHDMKAIKPKQGIGVILLALLTLISPLVSASPFIPTTLLIIAIIIQNLNPPDHA